MRRAALRARPNDHEALQSLPMRSNIVVTVSSCFVMLVLAVPTAAHHPGGVCSAWGALRAMIQGRGRGSGLLVAAALNPDFPFSCVPLFVLWPWLRHGNPETQLFHILIPNTM